MTLSFQRAPFPGNRLLWPLRFLCGVRQGRAEPWLRGKWDGSHPAWLLWLPHGVVRLFLTRAQTLLGHSTQLVPLLWGGARESTQPYGQLSEAWGPAFFSLRSSYLLKVWAFALAPWQTELSWVLHLARCQGDTGRHLTCPSSGRWTLLKRMWVGSSCPGPLDGTSSRWGGERPLGQLQPEWGQWHLVSCPGLEWAVSTFSPFRPLLGHPT